MSSFSYAYYNNDMFRMIRNDITKVKADVIADPCDPQPHATGGTDAMIYEAAGRKKLEKERNKIGYIEPGTVRVTSAFDLHAKYIFHTAGPRYTDGNHGEENILRTCYRNALKLCSDLSCSSIAFPLIASGTFGYPKQEAYDIAKSEITGYLSDHDLDVILCLYDDVSFAIAEKEEGKILSYIEENRIRENVLRSNDLSIGSIPVDFDQKIGMTFQELLFHWIDESGVKDTDIYRKANLDRKLFSKIRSSKDYHPKKDTAIALAFALHLNLDDTVDLIGRAGYAFSPASRRDLILEYCIEHEIYDLFDVNIILCDLKEKPL